MYCAARGVRLAFILHPLGPEEAPPTRTGAHMSDSSRQSDRQAEPRTGGAPSADEAGPRPQDGSQKVHGDVLEPLIPREADQKSTQDRGEPRRDDER